VEIGEKEGKFQHYKINWKRFVDESLNRVPTLSILEFLISTEKKEKSRKRLKMQSESLKKVLGELRENRYFWEFINIFCCNL
jgi:hypothetical protein